MDDRILHLIKRGWSGKDNPGERYDVLQIDYGCYVHLLGTNAAPQSLLGGDDEEDFSAVSVTSRSRRMTIALSAGRSWIYPRSQPTSASTRAVPHTASADLHRRLSTVSGRRAADHAVQGHPEPQTESASATRVLCRSACSPNLRIVYGTAPASGLRCITCTEVAQSIAGLRCQGP